MKEQLNPRKSGRWGNSSLTFQISSERVKDDVVVVEVDDVDSGRERLKRHRSEVAGRVSIPERWGQEECLKEWIDFCSLDASLVPSSGIASARETLVAEGRRMAVVPDRGLRIDSGC